jgi:hypothetical protein
VSRKVLLSLGVALLLVVGAVIWWQQGGVGGPVSDQAARKYFARVVTAAQRKDFDSLCRLNASVGTCQFDLRIACRPPAGGPIDPGKEILTEWCRQAVPTEEPQVSSSTHRPGRSGSVGGRLLVVGGTDGYGRQYQTEVLIFRDKRSYRATHAVFWSGEKFPATSEGG